MSAGFNYNCHGNKLDSADFNVLFGSLILFLRKFCPSNSWLAFLVINWIETFIIKINQNRVRSLIFVFLEIT